MSIEIHRQAEELMGQADIAKLRGELGKYRDLSLQAARLEEAAFNEIPEARAITRARIGSSAVRLYFRAEAFSDVLRAGAEILGKISPHQEWAHIEINEMITEAEKLLHL